MDIALKKNEPKKEIGIRSALKSKKTNEEPNQNTKDIEVPSGSSSQKESQKDSKVDH